MKIYTHSLFILIVGLLFSTFIFYYLKLENQEETREFFNSETRRYTNELLSSFNDSFHAVKSLQLLYATADDSIALHEFNSLSRILFSNSPGLKALEWIPVVDKVDRSRFTDQMKQTFPNFEFHGKGQENLGREFHLPVYYVYPFEPNQAAHGYDLASSQTRLDAFLKSARTANMILTDPIQLIQDADSTYGYLAILAVRHTQHIKNTPINASSFTIGVFNVNEVIFNSIQNIIFDKYHLQVIDQTADLEIFSNLNEVESDELFEHKMEVGNRALMIRYQPTPNMVMSQSRPTGLVLFIAGILISVILSIAFQLTSKKNQEILKSNRKIVESEKFFNLFFNNSPTGFYFMKFNEPISWSNEISDEKVSQVLSTLKISKANEAVISQFQMSEEEFLGLNPLSLFEDDLNYIRTVYRQLFTTGKSNVWIEFHSRDNSLKYLEGDLICLYDDFGKITGHFTIQVDVTDRQVYEKHLSQEADMLAVLAEVSSKFIDLPLEEIDANLNKALEKLGKLVNADRAYIFKYNLESRTSTNTYEWCATGVEAFKDEMQAVKFDAISELAAPHFKGKPIFIPFVDQLENDTSREMFTAQGIKSFLTVPLMSGTECLGFAGFDYVKDYRSYSEKEISILNLFADMIVHIQAGAKRMKENQTLLKKTIAQFGRLKDFSFIISHNIRSSVSNLLSINHILQIDPDDRSFIGLLDRSSRQLDRTISSVNNLLHVELDREGELQLESCNVKSFIKGVLDLNNKLISDRQIKIINKVPEGLMIQGKAVYLESILFNVLNNAFRYGVDDDNKLVEISARKVKSCIEVSVKDFGKGINLNGDLNKIFEAGSRYEKQTEGQGLGLFMVKSQMETLKGSVEVESKRNEGTVFRLIFMEAQSMNPTDL